MLQKSLKYENKPHKLLHKTQNKPQTGWSPQVAKPVVMLI